MRSFSQQPKFLMFLVMLYLVFSLLYGLFLNRLLDIRDILTPGGVYIFPVAFYIGDIIAEVYGYDLARNVIWASFFAELVFSLLAQLTLRLHPAAMVPDQDAYPGVFTHFIHYSLWLALGSLISGLVNVRIFNKLKLLLQGKYFWFRSLGATTIGQFVFSFITLIPCTTCLLSFDQSMTLAMSAYLFKLFYGLIISIPAVIVVHILRRIEPLELTMH